MYYIFCLFIADSSFVNLSSTVSKVDLSFWFSVRRSTISFKLVSTRCRVYLAFDDTGGHVVFGKGVGKWGHEHCRGRNQYNRIFLPLSNAKTSLTNKRGKTPKYKTIVLCGSRFTSANSSTQVVNDEDSSQEV